MIKNNRICIVLPAYNAEKTLRDVYAEIPFEIVDEVILVDDFSTDNTLAIAKELGIKHILEHSKNKGYGGNQKSCYRKALELNADVVVMLHPDYQYTPLLIESMCYLIVNKVYPVVLGSRILGKGARKGGMPLYKYIFNRFLTFFQNVIMNQKLAEYHTGYRAFSREVLEELILRSIPMTLSLTIKCWLRFSMPVLKLLKSPVHKILQRGLLHQFHQECKIWSWGSANLLPLSPAKMGMDSSPAF
jgi:glycosyltransferase involved in cell wall biosynthesis